MQEKKRNTAKSDCTIYEQFRETTRKGTEHSDLIIRFFMFQLCPREGADARCSTKTSDDVKRT